LFSKTSRVTIRSMLQTQIGILVFCTMVPLIHCENMCNGPDDNMDKVPLPPSLTTKQIERLFHLMDADDNRKLSLQELLAYASDMRHKIAEQDVSAILDDMDTNDDGRISLGERLKELESWNAFEHENGTLELEERKSWETQKFKHADANNDSFLTIDELPFLFFPETHPDVLHVHTTASLSMKDLNKNGKLSLAEFSHQHESSFDEELADHRKRDFAQLDVDDSGALSIEELKAWESGAFHNSQAFRKVLEVADTDHDLQITPEEFRAARHEIAAMAAHYQFAEWAHETEL